MGALLTPAHLLLFDHSFAYHLVDGRFHKFGRYRLAGGRRGFKQGKLSVSASLGVWYLGIGKWDHRVNTLTGSDVIARQLSGARPANWWVAPPSQTTTTPTPPTPSAPSQTPVPVAPTPPPTPPSGGVWI